VIESIIMNEQTERIRVLRENGGAPKEIARALGMRPAEVTRIIRALAAEGAANGAEPAVVGCWANHGWSAGLTVAPHPEWPDTARDDASGSGLVLVAVARRHRPRRVRVCGYLVDVYCLGVKDVLGPEIVKDEDLPAFLDRFFSAVQHGEPPLEVPLELARHLVYGGVDYARTLGFEPHPEFADAAGVLGEWQGPSAITFGSEGMPLYISGPYDNPRAVMRTLSRTVGDGNFHYMVGITQ
jgi:hypothetical protein